MSVLGNDFNQTIGLITASTEIMTGQASKVAKGLRSIGNEFANAAQDGNAIEYAVGGVTKQLSLLDAATGDMKSTFQIMSDLKDDWDRMTNAEKQAIAITYAGKTQFEVFAAAMNNFDTAVNASAMALNSAGSATQENEKIQESLDFKMQQLSATFQQFSNNVLDKEFIGSVVNAGNTLLEFANTAVGTTITQAALLGTTVASSIGMIMAVLSKLKGILQTAAGSGGIIGMLAAPKTLLIIGAIVAGLTIVANIIKHLKDDSPNIDELNAKLGETRTKLEELNKVPWYDRTQEWYDEKEAAEEYNAELQKTLDLEEKRQNNKPKYYQVTGVYDVGDGSTYEVLSGEFETMEEAVQNLADMMGTDYASALEAASVKSREAAFAYGALLEQYRNGEITEAELNDRTLELGKQYGVLVDEIKQRADAGGELLPMEQALLKVSQQVTNEVNLNRDAFYTLNGQLKLTDTQYQELLLHIPSLSGAIDRTNGVLSIQTSKLYDAAKAGNEYAKSLLAAAYAQSWTDIQNIQDKLEGTTISTEASSKYQHYLNALVEAKKRRGELHGYLGGLGYTNYGFGLMDGLPASLSGGTGATGGSGASVKKTVDYLEALKAKLEKYEHDIFLLTKQGEEKTAQTRINIYKNMQNMIHQRADEIRAMGLENEEELIRELQQLWWGYQDNITDILDFLKEKQIESIQATIDALEDQKDAYSDLGSLMADYIDGQISKIDEQNQALEDQIKLEEKLDELAQAKNKRMLVYKDGQFQYVSDTDAVSSAQAAYSAEKRTQDAQREKDRLQDLADKWRDFASDYVEAQNKINLEQKLGVDLSDENLERMVNDAQQWADRYIDIMEQISAKQQELNALNGATTSSGMIGGAKGTLSSYASGTVGARGGLSLVGENGPEIRVMRSGDGVIPADVTRNLWDWGKLSPKSIMSTMTTMFNIDNLTLPNVHNAETLVSGLKQMAYQRAYKRA